MAELNNGAQLMIYDPELDEWVAVTGTGNRNSNGGIYVNPQMPSHGFNRTKHENIIRMTASGQLGAWTAGTHLHMATLHFTGINTSTTNNSRFRIRQGDATGTIKYEFQHSTGAVGAPEHFSETITMDEHLIFHAEANPSTYYFEMLSGTLSIAFFIQGYEAPGA